MNSINATGDTLFPGVPDKAWLKLIDERYGNGLEIECSLGGSRSAGARTKTFRAYYLDKGGGHRRGSCVVKLGHRKEVLRDYEGWRTFGRSQPKRDSFANMDTPNEADFGAIVIIDLVGTEEIPMRSLAEETARGFPLLADAVARVIGSVLQPLHECLQPPDGNLPHLSLTQGDAIRNWMQAKQAEEIRERLISDPTTKDIWALDEVRDPEHFVGCPNHLPAVLNGSAVPHADAAIRLPHGIVHGDSNFDNVFVAHTTEPMQLANVKMIDFEWCTEDPPNSPYDDLARIECELLFGHEIASHPREMSNAVALGDPLMREGFPLSAGLEPDRAIFESIRIVRTRVVELAELAGAQTPEVTNAYLRGYLTTLFGQAMQYLRYDVPGDKTRSEILHLCQLLAARLATADANSMPPSFSPRLVAHDLKRGSVSNVDGIYVLEAFGASAYAGLMTTEPSATESFHALCTFEILEATSSGWVAFSAGADTDAPERSGLAAMVRPGNDARVRTSIVSHAESRHSRRGPVLGGLDETLASPLVARITRVPSRLEIAVEGGDGTLGPSTVSVEIPPEQYWGPFTLIAHQATVRVTSLKLRLIEMANAEDGNYSGSSAPSEAFRASAFPVVTSRKATEPG